MNKTEEVIGHLLSKSQHVSAMVTDDTEVWETHNKLVEHIRELDRKAEAFDQIIEISEECDNYMDFGDEIDAVIRSYKEERESDEL